MWKTPPALGEDDRVLSFLPPGQDDICQRQLGDRYESGRAIAERLRSSTLDAFVGLAARAGVVTDGRGRTLRGALQRPGQCSDWWFHSFSWRTLGADYRTTFDWVLTALAIDDWARRHGARTLHLHGASRLLVTALRSKYRVVATAPFQRPGAWRWPLDSLIERVLNFVWVSRTMRDAPRPAPPSLNGAPVVALTGHPWLHWDDRQQSFADSHFRDLPTRLREHGFRVVRLFWCVSRDGTIASPRDAAAACARGEAAPLQSFLTLGDVVRETLSFRALRVYLRWRRRPAFRAAFRLDGVDVFPFFRVALTSGFLGAQIPLARLGVLATMRACDFYGAAATICHFEWLIDGRAHYEGVRRSRAGTLATVMQHAPNTNVAFYNIHPAVEFRGEPDGCAMPRAGHVFAMGSLGVQRFLASGYQPNQITLTGCTRYDITALRAAVDRIRRAREPRRDELRVLVLPSSLPRDVDLIEAAYAAAADVPNIQVSVRRKPGSYTTVPLSSSEWASRVRFTEGSLADDLASADLVLFNASGAAEQAFACGVPTWQWMQVNQQGTSLADVVRLPQFVSVAALRAALNDFVANPERHAPPAAETDLVARAIFGPADGLQATRIAEQLRLLVPARGAETRAALTQPV